MAVTTPLRSELLVRAQQGRHELQEQSSARRNLDRPPSAQTHQIAASNRKGRVIPLNKELRDALQLLHKDRRTSPFVIGTERSERTSASAIVNLFASWYRAAGLQGCSSHSGRRTFITNAARTIFTVGGSLRDVQILAGHSALSTTQRYIEADAEAQKRVVDLV